MFTALWDDLKPGRIGLSNVERMSGKRFLKHAVCTSTCFVLCSRRPPNRNTTVPPHLLLAGSLSFTSLFHPPPTVLQIRLLSTAATTHQDNAETTTPMHPRSQDSYPPPLDSRKRLRDDSLGPPSKRQQSPAYGHPHASDLDFTTLEGPAGNEISFPQPSLAGVRHPAHAYQPREQSSTYGGVEGAAAYDVGEMHKLQQDFSQVQHELQQNLRGIEQNQQQHLTEQLAHQMETNAHLLMQNQYLTAQNEHLLGQTQRATAYLERQVEANRRLGEQNQHLTEQNERLRGGTSMRSTPGRDDSAGAQAEPENFSVIARHFTQKGI